MTEVSLILDDDKVYHHIYWGLITLYFGYMLLAIGQFYLNRLYDT